MGQAKSTAGQQVISAIDVVLATYNRAGQLPNAINSLVAARKPGKCEVRLFVVDNNSNDSTKQVINSLAAESELEIIYCFEKRQGRSHALNCGISKGVAPVVAFIDDDETVDSEWLCVIQTYFEKRQAAYIGGPVLPKFGAPCPSWVPNKGWGGVLGIIDNGPVVRRYGSAGFPGMLTGGNCAIRRNVLDRCGPYLDTYMYAEDRLMYARLLEDGGEGYYVPDLIIHHHIPAKRLKPSYFREWASTEGLNDAREWRKKKEQGMTSAKSLLGVPLWLWRVFISASVLCLFGWLPFVATPAARFAAELEICRVWSFFLESKLRRRSMEAKDRA